MKRRTFIKSSIAAAAALWLPRTVSAAPLDFTQINFDPSIYANNSAQTIVVYLYGGASQLSGNLSNLDDIKAKSQSNYNYFGNITLTANSCWQEAGGAHMEALIDAGDMTIFRTCYSEVREANNNKAHGVCTAQNQSGSFVADSAGVITNLAQILQNKGLVTENTILPFIMLEGESVFYREGDVPLDAFLKPVALNQNLDNPYSRYLRDWRYYTAEERASAPDDYNNAETGFDPALHAKMDELAQSMNSEGKIKDAFARRGELDNFIETIKAAVTPDLGEDAYIPNNGFAARLETSIKILVNNPETKMITMGADGLGGWDDHDDARNYVTRMESLFRSLRSAMAHLRAEGKDDTVNILVFGEFGRNVNLNSALGWDHGNLQNLYVLGGKKYFSHQGVVGETVVSETGPINRLFLKPKEGSYQFEPLSIAATLYKIYGVTNPETLTDGYVPVSI